MGSRPLIAIFCNSFPPEGGGAAGRIYNLAVVLRDAGYRVQVVCAMPNYPKGKIFPAYRSKLVVDETADGISVRRVWLSPSNSASKISRGWSMFSFVLSLKLFAFRKVRKLQPELVIVSSPPLPMAAAVVRYFKAHKHKVLLNISDIWPLSANALGAMDKSGLYSRLERMERRMYGAADAITAQSNDTLEHIRKQLGRLPVATMLYRNLPPPLQTSNDIPEKPGNSLKIIYPGLLGHAQGIYKLCSSIDFSTLNAELHIYGDGPEADAVRSLIALHPQRGIFLHKPVGTAALIPILQAADAMLIPLVKPIEGALPSKLFTAMQAGLPALYSGGGEGEAIVAAHRLGFTAAPGDYDKITAQIRALSMLNAADYAGWRRHIHEVSERHFSKAAQDEDFLALIAAIVDSERH